MGTIKEVGQLGNRRVFVCTGSLELFPFMRAIGEVFVVKLRDKTGQYRCYCNFEGTKEQIITHIKSYNKLDDDTIDYIMRQAEKPEFCINSTDKV